VSAASLVGHAQGALLLAVLLSLPVLLATLLVGLVVGAFQGATQIQDPAVSHLPRVLAGALALGVAAPWMGHALAELATRVLLAAAG
jgi:flagellar biosynthetic protein FliQ